MADPSASPADGILTAELERLSRIEQQATKGPWKAVAGLWTAEDGKQQVFPAVISSDGDPSKAGTWLVAAGTGSADPESNAEFIAEARTAMPRLVAAIQRLSELADEWEQEGFRLDAEAFMNCARALREAITKALSGNPGAQEAQRGERS